MELSVASATFCICGKCKAPSLFSQVNHSSLVSCPSSRAFHISRTRARHNTRDHNNIAAAAFICAILFFPFSSNQHLPSIPICQIASTRIKTFSLTLACLIALMFICANVNGAAVSQCVDKDGGVPEVTDFRCVRPLYNSMYSTLYSYVTCI